jgi:folate-binding protein YgfZ
MNELGYKGLRERAAWIDLTGRGKIRASGEDRARLLHAMTTNQVQQLTPGSGCYAFFLTAQGRILADVNLFCLPEYFLLDTEPETKQRLYEHLDKFIIADDVTLEDATETMATISVEGPEAEEILNELGAPIPGSEYAIEAWGSWLVARASSTGVDGLTIFLPLDEKTQLVSILETAEVPEADAEAATAVRLENHRPRYGPDIDESLIPQETQQMHAIHFAKGCYLGQEIVERVRSRGHLNKMLVPIEIDTQDPVDAGTRVFMDAKDMGRITSAAFSPALQKTVAFAVVRVDALGGQALSVNGAPAIAAASRVPA